MAGRTCDSRMGRSYRLIGLSTGENRIASKPKGATGDNLAPDLAVTLTIFT